jgi:hypothetical protein
MGSDRAEGLELPSLGQGHHDLRGGEDGCRHRRDVGGLTTSLPDPAEPAGPPVWPAVLLPPPRAARVAAPTTPTPAPDDCSTIHSRCWPLARGELVRKAREVLRHDGWTACDAGVRRSRSPGLRLRGGHGARCPCCVIRGSKTGVSGTPRCPNGRLRRGQSTSVACIYAPVRLSRLCGRHITTLQHNRVKSPTLSRAGLLFTSAVASAGVRDGSRAMTIQEETCISVRL